MVPEFLNTVGNWFIKMCDSHKYPTISIEKPIFSCMDTDNPSMYVDVETETGLARVTLWASQECDMEMISKDTGATLMEKHIRMKENNYQEKCICFLLEISEYSR